jgi:hypothetical protein
LVLLKSSSILSVLVLVDALLMAYGHYPIISAISRNFPFGAYFLFATVVYILGGVFIVANKLFKLSVFSLILLAVIDCLLLLYTRPPIGSMDNIFTHRIVPWSYGWSPLGTVQVFVGQVILIVLCAVLYKTRSSPTK